MAFESFADFIQMSGHGVYVWPAFMISVALLKILFFKPLWQQHQLLKTIHQQSLREKSRSMCDGGS